MTSMGHPETKKRLNAARLILSAALAAAVLCQSCVRNVEPREEELSQWMDVPVPPVVSLTAYACASDVHGTLFLGADWNPNMWRSTDRGRTWTQKTLGINPCCRVSAILAKGGDTVFAALMGGGVFISRDRGDSWIQVNNHLTDLNISSLAAAADGQIMAGTAAGRIFRSPNDGGVWVEVEGPVGREVSTLVVDSAGTLYAGCGWEGVFSSTDNGETWTQSMNGLENISARCLAIDHEGRILLGTYEGGIYRSAGAGEPWVRIDQGTTTAAVNSIAIDPAGCVFAGTDGDGVICSRDGGDSWERADTGLQGLSVISLLCTNDILLAGTWGEGVFRSTDGGGSWALPRNYFPLDPDRYHSFWSFNALSVDSSGTYYLVNRYSILRSRDHAETWIRACYGLKSWPTCLAIHPNSSILAGTDAGIYISNDSGDSWSRADTLPSDSMEVHAIEVAGDGAAFAHTEAGVVRSMDGGSSWEYVSKRTDVTSISTGSNGCVYFGTFYEGVMGSTDYGDTWRRMTDSLLVYSIDADLIGNVFVVSEEEGILRSHDRGDNWSVFLEGRGYYFYQMIASPGGEIALFFDDGGTLYISEDAFSSWRTVSVPFQNATMSLSPDGYLFFSKRFSPGLHRSKHPLF